MNEQLARQCIETGDLTPLLHEGLDLLQLCYPESVIVEAGDVPRIFVDVNRAEILGFLKGYTARTLPHFLIKQAS